MQGDPPFLYSPLDFLFMFGGLFFFLADIVLDIFAVVTFYQEEAYVSLGLLVLFLVGSSVIAQVYSWLWYSYDGFRTGTCAESCLTRRSCTALHVLQMGVYLRYAGLVEFSLRSFLTNSSDPGGMAVYLSHDLSMLRLIENFTESSPQLVLMVAIILQKNQLEPFTLLKAAGSASAIACGVTMYHRSLRSFLPEKAKQTAPSSLIYFLWNLLLIMARLAALSLFASALPCFIIPHFLCSWIIMFFCAWRCKTEFMDSSGAEWLFRATVGLIWYFCWFNVAEGQTRFKLIVYHVWMMLDLVLLCGLWCWKMYVEPTLFAMPQVSHSLIVSSCVIACYCLGIALQLAYYKFFHPTISKPKHLEGAGEEPPKQILINVPDTVDHPGEVVSDGETSDDMDRQMRTSPKPVQKRQNKRMQKLAENFYS